MLVVSASTGMGGLLFTFALIAQLIIFLSNFLSAQSTYLCCYCYFFDSGHNKGALGVRPGIGDLIIRRHQQGDVINSNNNNDTSENDEDK